MRQSLRRLLAMMLYTVGYQRWPFDRLVDQVVGLDALLVDVRMRARSQNPFWERESIAAALGGRYVHLPAFGNRNYANGGPVVLHNPKAGIDAARRLIAAHKRPLIFLCGCPDHQGCHRTVAADLTADALGLEVQHLVWQPADKPAPAQLSLF